MGVRNGHGVGCRRTWVENELEGKRTNRVSSDRGNSRDHSDVCFMGSCLVGNGETRSGRKAGTGHELNSGGTFWKREGGDGYGRIEEKLGIVTICVLGVIA